jgi:tetratricopeptide (TPR) repeat protein
LAGVLAFCLLGLAAHLLYPPIKGSFHWRRSEQALANDNLASARSHLEECLRVWPTSGEVQFLLARTCRRQGDLDEARRRLEEARRLGWVPELIDLEVLLAQAQAGKMPLVEDRLRRRLAEGHRDAELILEALVKGCLECQFLDQAYGWSNDWVGLTPQSWQAHYWQGQVLEAGLRYDLAAEAYARAVERNNQRWEAHFRLGEMRLRQSRFADAASHFSFCLEADPERLEARVNLARCQRMTDSSAAAWATLRPCLSSPSPEAEALLVAGQLELDAGRAEAACEWLQRALALAPHDFDICQTLGRALHLANRSAEAADYDRRADAVRKDLRSMDRLIKEIAGRPRDAALRREAGATLLRLGQRQQAARWLVSALVLEPGQPATLKALAECLQDLNDPEIRERCRRLLEN